MVCELQGIDTRVFGAPELRRARTALKKREGPSRVKQFIVQELTRRLVNLAAIDGDYRSAILYLVTYAFLLRMPSEALPKPAVLRALRPSGRTPWCSAFRSCVPL